MGDLTDINFFTYFCSQYFVKLEYSLLPTSGSFKDLLYTRTTLLRCFTEQLFYGTAACNLTKKNTPLQVLSLTLCKIFQNTPFFYKQSKI